MKKFVSLLLIVLLVFSLCPAAFAYSPGFGEPEEVSLVIGGAQISKGRGFLKNFTYLTVTDMDTIASYASGESTYRLGLGDSFSEMLTYSTFENHGTPVWGWRRVYGLDLTLLAQALGIDTSKVMSVTASSDDGMVKTLSDAFGVGTKRYFFDPSGSPVSEVGPILALFQTESETGVEIDGTYPAMPKLGADSSDRVNNVFGYGQTAADEINACFWVKCVNRLRFGAEDVALTVTDAAGKKVTASVSGIVSNGVWSTSFGSVRANGIPLSELLDAMGVSVPDGKCVIARSSGGRSMVINDPGEVFAAWYATDSGSAVANSTSLRLYSTDGGEFANLVSLTIEDDYGDIRGFTLSPCPALQEKLNALFPSFGK